MLGGENGGGKQADAAFVEHFKDGQIISTGSNIDITDVGTHGGLGCSARINSTHSFLGLHFNNIHFSNLINVHVS